MQNEKQNDGTFKTGVSANAEFTITKAGKPLSNVSVNEKNTTKTTLNGQARPLKTVETPGSTDANGKMTDTFGLLAPAGSAKDDKILIHVLQNQKVAETDTQTLTFKAPDGATCSCTGKRTLTNVGADGNASATYTVKPMEQELPVTPAAQ